VQRRAEGVAEVGQPPLVERRWGFPKPITSNSSSGESRRDRSANSSIVSESSRRWIDDSTRGTASEMKPGLLPVPWIDVPPRAQAASTRSRTAGSRLAARWNSPRVATMLAPDSSSRHTSSKSQRAGM
jgi:hypothetical protein